SGRRAAQVECRDQLLSRKPRADELCRMPSRRLAHRQRRHRSRLQRTHQVPVLPQRDALETRVWGADFATSRNQALTTMGQLLGECYAASYVVVHQGEITPFSTRSMSGSPMSKCKSTGASMITRDSGRVSTAARKTSRLTSLSEGLAPPPCFGSRLSPLRESLSAFLINVRPTWNRAAISKIVP